jgi:cytochrome c oxidase subunit 2
MEYCGTKHSGMIGQVVAMTPEDYDIWLSGGAAAESPLVAGERLFTEYACVTCHTSDTTARGPNLAGLAGSTVTLVDGRTVVADDNYLRESIMMAPAKVVRGYQPLMPLFQGTISEENVMQLVAYIKSLPGAPAASH